MSDFGNGSAGRADVVIVGGGSAGSVLAARLSEDPTRSVLMLEAGRAYGADGYPDDLLDAARVPAAPEHEWGFTARGGPAAPQIDAARAKVLGGCSTHNATVAMRARPSDIVDWQRHGLDTWTIEDVDATYQEMENMPDGGDAYHGRTGPFPIRQLKYDDLTTSLRGFIDASVAEGFRHSTDFNGPDPSGVGGYPVNVIEGVRQNTGLVYLTEEVRNRPNLKISGDVLVDRVLFNQRRAVGVVTASGSEIPAGEVILSGGLIRDPGDPLTLRCRPGRRPGPASHRCRGRSAGRTTPAGPALLLQRVCVENGSARHAASGRRVAVDTIQRSHRRGAGHPHRRDAPDTARVQPDRRSDLAERRRRQARLSRDPHPA